MPEKMLGQLAFEAYVDAVGGETFDGKPIPGWEDLSGDGGRTRAAWQDAANAVVSRVAVENGAVVRVDAPAVPDENREIPG